MTSDEMKPDACTPHRPSFKPKLTSGLLKYRGERIGITDRLGDRRIPTISRHVQSSILDAASKTLRQRRCAAGLP